MVDAILQRIEPSMAAKQFWFFFFAGSGALGIGAAQVPKILASFDALKSLAASPLTEGGLSLPSSSPRFVILATAPTPLAAALFLSIFLLPYLFLSFPSVYPK